MAFILVIIGLLVGIGAGMLRILVPREKALETKNTLKTVEQAILGYAQDHKKLPTDLNALDTKTKDAYGEDILYYPKQKLVSNICSPPPGPVHILSVNDTGTVKNDIAYVIMSKGANHCDQTQVSPNVFHIHTPGASLPGSCAASDGYDDQVIYRDIDSLRAITCEGFRITTHSLPEGEVGVPYPHTQLSATDGALPYIWNCNPTHPAPGLSCNIHGIIYGTPSAAGVYPV